MVDIRGLLHRVVGQGKVAQRVAAARAEGRHGSYCHAEVQVGRLRAIVHQQGHRLPDGSRARGCQQVGPAAGVSRIERAADTCT